MVNIVDDGEGNINKEIIFQDNEHDNNIDLDRICRDWVRALLLLDEWSQAQLTKYNKFVENEFNN